MPDEARLRDWALRYLARYATSRARLAAYLERRALRLAKRAGKTPDPGLRAAIARVVGHCAELGIVDDRTHARARLRRLVQRGASVRRLRADLAERGIAPAIAAEELAGLGEELGADPERVAARALLRRRGLLPQPGADWTEEARRRALAALARAGFSYEVASEVVGEAAGRPRDDVD